MLFALTSSKILTGHAKSEMVADAVDNFSRLLIDRAAWLRGDLALPDLTSTGVKD